jgi:hypothetical protein
MDELSGARRASSIDPRIAAGASGGSGVNFLASHSPDLPSGQPRGGRRCGYGRVVESGRQRSVGMVRSD